MPSRLSALRADIAVELDNLQRLTAEMEMLLGQLPDAPGSIETRAAGSILHDFYTGIEKAFRRIALQTDGSLPGGEDWHVQLLHRMTTDLPDTRPAVISHEMARDLSEYLRFRHLFRNVYGFDLRWELLDRLTRQLPAVNRRLSGELRDFQTFLSTLPDG